MAKRSVINVPPWVPRWLGNVLILGVVIHGAAGAAWLTWFVLWEERPVTSIYHSGATATGASAQVRAPLASMELFGRPPSNQPVPESVRRNAPETRLRLTLEGVMVAERPENSGAIVTSGGNITAHYRVGDVIPGNAELVEVEPQRILIRRQGALESLTFDEDSDGPALAAMETEMETDESSGDFLDEAQERLASEGANALLAFGLQPVEDGGSQGYVFDGSNAMLRAVNLREGDVITAINGYPLGDVEQDRQLLETLRSESQLQVEVERDGARFTVTYALPQ